MKKILLVEDDETTNFLNKLVLADAGYPEVVEAFNGKEAYEFLRSECPDLIFLDINMPVMDGWEFLEEKKTSATCLSTKIVMLTSSTLPSDREKIREFPDVIAFLEKPLTVDKIRHVRSIL